ncbi:hypothetical protein ACJDU8_10660 [Clostridium sp. WILCCON 0269]|uniref:Uncharacterized protein n=1 Tax=Candidatus Clostridium eludens TaxID=3381663 RepID=A0ABW8SK01_9CLOT
MKKVDEAINRIRILECPTGELENRVVGILEDYEVANRVKVSIDRDDNLDRANAQAYRVQIPDEGQSFVVLARSRYDDYVAKVVDIYTE